nr:retrotransposon protein, putative, Ty1-copia subclass [Tanacetum cinerariifolium]
MCDLLIQHGCEAALEVLPADMKAEAKAELNKKAHNAVILCLANKALREVIGETTAAKISEHIDEFNKIVLDLTNIEVKFEDEDLALLLLTSLPESYEHFVDSLLYGWVTLILEDVMVTLNSKKIKERSKAKGDNGEWLYVRGRTNRRDLRQSKGKSRSKSRGGRLKCYIFQSEDHLKRNCPKNNRKKSTGYVKKDEQPSSSGSTYDNSEVMMVVSAQAQALLDWIMDSGCSYHMTSRYIPELKRNLISLGTLKKEGYTVKLQSGKVKVINGSRVILSGIRRDNCVYSLDGHAMSGGCGFISSGSNTKHLESLKSGRKFEQLCVESEIARHLTFAGTLQLNRVAKRMNRTLMDKVRCLLIKYGLPKTFWAEATCTAAYLINRSSSRAIKKKTPMEMWSGHASDYGMLRIFSCVAYPHDKQGKLEPRAVKCVLLGYLDGVKGYKLYRLDDESPKIVTSRNVVFNESVMYKDTLKDSGAGDKSVEELQAGDQETDQTTDLTNYQLARDRERRTRTKPLRFLDESNMAAYAFAVAEEEDTHDPLTYQKAVACEDISKSSSWVKAGEFRMDVQDKRGIEGVQKPRYKARLVACGFTQRACVDYNEVFSSVVRHTSIRVVLALTTCKDYELEQLDVKMTFLHGNLEELIYLRQPPGYEQGNMVCLLKKSLYGLKQSHKQWYRRFDVYMLSNGFKRSSYDNCVYYRSYALGEYINLLLYVDDMLIACKSKVEIGSTKSLLKKEFDMKELREAKRIHGMEIVKDRSRKILRVSQSEYVSKILNNFRTDNEKSVKMLLGGHFKLSLKDCRVRDCDVERMSKVPYANAIGSLMYLMVCTRPGIAYEGTANMGLVYGIDHGNHVDVTGFVNSDYAKDPDKRRSITGYAFLVQEAIWLRGLLEELDVELNTVIVNCDNQGAIHLSQNHVFHERTKHIDVVGRRSNKIQMSVNLAKSVSSFQVVGHVMTIDPAFPLYTLAKNDERIPERTQVAFAIVSLLVTMSFI